MFVIVLDALHSTWRQPVAIPSQLDAKLARLSNFQDGWAFGQGRRFTREVVSQAKAIVAAGLATHNFKSVDVFPGRYGQLVVSLYLGEDQYDFAVSEDGILESSEIGDELTEGEHPLTLEDAITAVQRIGSTWASYFCSTKKNTIEQKSASAVTLLNPIETVKASRYLIETAPFANLNASVLMLTATTDHPLLKGKVVSTSGTSTLPSSPQGTPWKLPSARAETIATEISAD